MSNPIEDYYDRHGDAYQCYGRAIDPYTKQDSFVIVVNAQIGGGTYFKMQISNGRELPWNSGEPVAGYSSFV